MLCWGLRRPWVLGDARQLRELRQFKLRLRRWGSRRGGQARGQSGRGDGGDDRNSGGIAGRGGRACLGGSPIRLLLLLGLPPRGELLLGGICPRQRQGAAHQGQQGAEHEATEVGRRQRDDAQDDASHAGEDAAAAPEPGHQPAGDQQGADDEGGHPRDRRHLDDDVRNLQREVRRGEDHDPAQQHHQPGEEGTAAPPLGERGAAAPPLGEPGAALACRGLVSILACCGVYSRICCGRQFLGIRVLRHGGATGARRVGGCRLRRCTVSTLRHLDSPT